MRFIRNWYQLLEGQGLVASDSGPGAATGTLTANVTWAPFYHPPGTLYGYKGAVIGPSWSRISSLAAGTMNPTVGSIEMLVRPTWAHTDGIVHTFFDTNLVSYKYFRLLKNVDAKLYLMTNSINRGSFTYVFVAGSLYHIVLNWGTNALYINGVLVNTYTAAGLGVPASTLYIGDHASVGSSSFSGTIYYFIVRDVALTLAEIATFKTFFEKQYIPD